MPRLLAATRGAALVVLCALLPGPARAQSTSGSPTQSVPAPAAAPTAAAPTTTATPVHPRSFWKLWAQVSLLRVFGEWGRIPEAEDFTRGGRVIPAGAVVRGPVGVSDGALEVYGRLEGSAYAVGGDIRVHDGGTITGDALAYEGHVLPLGGRVDGESHSFAGMAAGVAASMNRERAPLGTVDMVKLVVGWFAILFVIGVGVMVFAETNLDGVVVALERGFGRAFWIGVLGQLALLPTLLLLIVGLALTILGALLIPFAIVSYVVVAAGVVTLGFLAVARMTGGGIARRPASPRTDALRGLLVGLGVFFALWAAVALFTWSPLASTILRGIAIAVTWTAATVGFGAALASRAGTQRPGAARPTPRIPDDLAWQTPTPVAGVAAARRPVAGSRSS